MEELLEVKIAKDIENKGGRAYYVGGYVRDKFLGIDNKDIDIEIHGLEPLELMNILNKYGTVITTGSSFGVYNIKGYSIDFAMPRKEKNTGRGHKDFEVYVDPYIGTYGAAKRRDFTINAIMEDVLTHEIIDHFKGVEDIKNKIIRHVNDESFVEDPLRVLRACQFASRFLFTVDAKTIALCKSIDITYLSKERVYGELKKALIKGQKPSIFFDYLMKMEQMDYWFKEIKKLKEIAQDPKYHPEGDTYIHTMMVVDEATKYRGQVSNDLNFSLLCLCHDFGKIISTFKTETGRIHAFDHENTGLPLIRDFLNRIGASNDQIHYVLNMTPLHMSCHAAYRDKQRIITTCRFFDKAVAPKDLIYFSFCDHPNADREKRLAFLNERLKIYEERMAKPYINGQDLIMAGIKPGHIFSEALNYAHDLRLKGIPKEEMLQKTLAYIEEID